MEIHVNFKGYYFPSSSFFLTLFTSHTNFVYRLSSLSKFSKRSSGLVGSILTKGKIFRDNNLLERVDSHSSSLSTRRKGPEGPKGVTTRTGKDREVDGLRVWKLSTKTSLLFRSVVLFSLLHPVKAWSDRN